MIKLNKDHKDIILKNKIELFNETLREIVISVMNIRSSMKVLDVGCGTGNLHELFLEYGALLTGIDINRDLIEKNKKNNKSYFPIDYMKMNAHSLHFPENFFDLSISIMGMEFFEDPRKVFSEMYRVTKKYGRIIIVTLNSQSKWSRFLYKNSSFFENSWKNICFRNMDFLFSLNMEELEYIKQGLFINPWATLNNENLVIKKNIIGNSREEPGILTGIWRKE